MKRMFHGQFHLIANYASVWLPVERSSTTMFVSEWLCNYKKSHIHIVILIPVSSTNMGECPKESERKWIRPDRASRCTYDLKTSKPGDSPHKHKPL